jgi:hypothetical protein
VKRPGSLLALVALVALAVTGCVHTFQPPRGDQPHAVVKLRRTYLTGAGTGLHESASVLTDEESTTGPLFQSSVDSSLAGSPRVDGVLMYPVPFQLTVSSEFFHVESRQVQESYQEQVPYQTTESYDCSSGYGPTRTYQTCTRQVTQYRSETRYRTVTKLVEVSDGECQANTTARPAEGHVYLMDYVYRARGVCNLTCVEQEVAPGEGQFKTHPCPR